MLMFSDIVSSGNSVKDILSRAAALNVNVKTYRLIAEIACIQVDTGFDAGAKLAKSAAKAMGLTAAEFDAALADATEKGLIGQWTGAWWSLNSFGDKFVPAPSTAQSASKTQYFDEYWKAYPRKTAKRYCAVVYERIAKELARERFSGSIERAEKYILSQLRKALPKLNASAPTDGREDYRPHPASWLNRNIDDNE